MADKRIVKRKSRLALYAFGGALVIAAALLVTVGRPYLRQAADWIAQENVEISSATISVKDQGAGSPTVIIIIGMATKKFDYRSLQDSIAQYTRVISYDRPGLGASGRNSEPRTFDVFARDLDELLQVKQVPPPYVLVGHSMGGLFIRYYADLHPESIAGLVFLDTSHEDWFQYIEETWSAEDQQRYFEFWDDSNPEYTGVRREEKAAFEENFNMVRGSKIDEDMPVLVFTGGRHHHFRTDPEGLEEDRQKWIELHASLIEGVKKAKHIVHLEMNHWLHSQIPDEVAREMDDMFEFENDTAQ